MSNLRVVFMGTPEFAVPCLTSLVDKGSEVKAVATQPDRPKGRGQKPAFSPVKEAALLCGLPVLQPEKIKDGDFLQNIADLKPDILVVVAFGHILPPSLLSLPSLGCVNVHASLLPKYRGAAPIHWAVINGEDCSGVTTMYMDSGLDTGDMILKAQTPITSETTTGELHDVLKNLGAKVLMDTLDLIKKGQVSREKQEGTGATYAPKLTRELEKIDWGKPAIDIHNLVRGLNPWPGAYSYHQEKSLKIWKTKVYSPDQSCLEPGQIIELTKDGFLVAAGQGVLEIMEVQPQSKRRMKAGEYAKGCVCFSDKLS